MTDEQRRAAERDQQEPQSDEARDERVDDLDVPEDQSHAVKGGGNNKWSDIEL